MTPLENPAVNGPWICNKGRDLAQIFERPRAPAGDAARASRSISLSAIAAARRADRRRAARPSRWCRAGARTRSSPRSSRARRAASRPSSRQDCAAAAGRAPRGRSADPRRQESEHGRGAGAVSAAADDGDALAAATRPRRWCGARASTSPACPARRERSSSSMRTLQPENGHADVFIPISIQTERRGHYTNFEGVVSAFEPCFRRSRRRRRRRGAVRRDGGTEDAPRMIAGPRRLRSSSSATRWRCCSCSARC